MTTRLGGRAGWDQALTVPFRLTLIGQAAAGLAVVEVRDGDLLGHPRADQVGTARDEVGQMGVEALDALCRAAGDQ